MLAQDMQLAESHRQMCARLNQQFVLVSSRIPFEHLYSVVCSRLLPLKLPPHIHPVQSPLILCPILSERLDLTIPNCEL